MSYSAASVILQAVRFAADADIQSLQHCIACHLDVLTIELTLRIVLSYLPESTNPSLYTDFLQELTDNNPNPLDDTELGKKALNEPVSKEEASRQVRALRLLSLSSSSLPDFELADIFTRFLLIRAHRIDTETGSLPLVQTLLEPFLDSSDYLRTWLISTLLPLLRLEYEYYPHVLRSHSLDEFEMLEPSTAIDTLLSGATKGGDRHDLDIGRDLRGLVGPWMYGETHQKRRKLEIEGQVKGIPSSSSSSKGRATASTLEAGWAKVNEWILDLSLRNFEQAVHVVENWDGPKDIDYGGWNDENEEVDDAYLEVSTLYYTQTGLATMYATNNASLQIIEGMYTILSRITHLLNLPRPPSLRFEDEASDSHTISSEFLDTLYPFHILENALLNHSNPITSPSKSSISLSYLILRSAYILHSIGHTLSYKRIANLSLFNNLEDQRAELKRVLHTAVGSKIMDAQAWASIRPKLLWLRDWSSFTRVTLGKIGNMSCGVFHQVDHVDFETEILGALLNAGQYGLAVEIYCLATEIPVTLNQIEKVTIEFALAAYDNASNGNKNRGDVKKASDVLNAFWSHFQTSRSFQEVAALIAATHALSYYSLILQHGVPFQPVNIRVHPDPIALIDKVLNQNPRSYSKLDDLLGIGRNLVQAGLIRPTEFEEAPKITREDQIILTERRITALAIKAALAEDDFDTAYSYVVNRLSLSSPNDHLSNESPELQDAVVDDITWRAAYQAGHAQSRNLKSGSKLRRLEQRMELLSQALLLAPKSAIEDILHTWRDCEREMNLVLAEEIEEENRWDDQGDRQLPGGFSVEDSETIIQKPREPTRNAINEEAPMGLFDVARGAAAALSKSAFPLRSPRTTQLGSKPPMQSPVQTFRGGDSIHSDDSGLSISEGEGRVRKRDMVSNLVTGGLASGIGWVIGAPATPQK